jgi:DNA invertase Pin-like site-specific DNA recombinase/transcription elongation factor Elf1
MKNVIIYGRVSTDEQALTGYSLPDQMDKLEKYCEQKGYTVVLRITEDYSAKTFERPAFTKVKQFIKENKGVANLFLVSKWSRFSRNTSESYQVINTFRKQGIEVNAIEQPIDWNIPQNKYLLAFYLTEPEVDNDIRSKSVVDGMRRANKEGRYLGHAPKGYRNARDNQTKPILLLSHIAPLVKEAFCLMETGAYTQMEVRELLNKKGLDCSRSQFSIMMTNRLYAGKVFIRPTIDEQGYWAEGIHEPLIDEITFDKVQHLLNQRRAARKSLKVKTRDENLPLRGFLQCGGCGKKMTGSKSKGNGGSYYYYHCNNCGKRHKATLLNDTMVAQLEQLEFTDGIKELYMEVIKDLFKGSDNERRVEITAKTEELKKYENRLEKLFDEKVDGLISNDDYQIGKKRYAEQISKLKCELEELKAVKPDFDKYLSWGMGVIQGIGKNYQAQDINGKQKLLGSIYPELIIFEENELRTNKINQVAELIATFNKASKGHKKKTGQLKTDLSCLVARRAVVKSLIIKVLNS